MIKHRLLQTVHTALVSALCIAVASPTMASSHREAPYITQQPKVDGTDFYAFASYEAGREDYITLLANYIPLQDAYGGPNYFSMDPNALYEIHIDNDGDAVEDVTFQWVFDNALVGGDGIALDIDGTPCHNSVGNSGSRICRESGCGRFYRAVHTDHGDRWSSLRQQYCRS